MTKTGFSDWGFRLIEVVLVLPLALLCLPLWGLNAVLAWLEGHSWLEKRWVARGRDRKVALWEARPLTGFGSGLLNREIFRLSPRLLGVLLGRVQLVGPGLLDPEAVHALGPEHLARFEVRPGLVSRYFLQSSLNIAFQSEADLALEDVHHRKVLTKLGQLIRGCVALVLRGSGSHEPPSELVMFGLKMVNETRAEAVERLVQLASGSGLTQVTFVNPGCVNILMKDMRYREALGSYPVVFPDGIGIKIAGRYLHQPLRDNLNGTDLFPAICERIQGSGQGIYLLGARPGVCEAMVENLSEKWPLLRVSGFRHGYIKDEQEENEVIAAINESGATWLFVAMGVPAQELWLHRVAPKLHVKVALGVGGLFDFMSGRIRRAPLWLREMGLEWAFRLALEPRRLWRRYVIGNFVFLWHLVRYHR